MAPVGSGVCDNGTGAGVRLPWRVCVGCNVEREGHLDHHGHHDRWLRLHADIDPQESGLPLKSSNDSCRI